MKIIGKLYYKIDEVIITKNQFVDSDKGLFLIADHYNADRNMNTWDSTEVYNSYNRSIASQYNLGGVYGDMRNPQNAASGWLSQNFGIRYRFNAIDLQQL